MDILTVITFLFYLMSTAGYTVYLFQQENRLYKAGYFLLITGFLCHTIVLGHASVVSGHIPVHNLRGTLLVAGWAVAGVFLAFHYLYHLKVLGIIAAPLAALVIFFASQLTSVPYQAKSLFTSLWLVFHIITIFLGNAAFAMAFGAGLLYLIQEHSIKSKIHGFFFRRLPSLQLIDNTGYACVVVGFTMLTIGLITGLVYAKLVWGRFWDWDPKEVWSGITWLVYAALLHGRISLGWRGRKAAIISIIGFGVLLFTFAGVNFLLTGHHGEFTRF